VLPSKLPLFTRLTAAASAGDAAQQVTDAIKKAQTLVDADVVMLLHPLCCAAMFLEMFFHASSKRTRNAVMLHADMPALLRRLSTRWSRMTAGSLEHDGARRDVRQDQAGWRQAHHPNPNCSRGSAVVHNGRGPTATALHKGRAGAGVLLAWTAVAVSMEDSFGQARRGKLPPSSSSRFMSSPDA
jgi:hypothetical protein